MVFAQAIAAIHDSGTLRVMWEMSRPRLGVRFRESSVRR